ncbi:hypothetical protein N7478_013390 [Penicillium angulare]|uniref:uncharacterized protein n=1 Tax=Penicillium angulare TaxID=116970 RepID=UPI0025418EAB|nr:uncharacterized protein N7478_013390 [Penicillium angulare]KAJ5257286.1 hypothetical protein N7478_013390 [Penicillium angulare]
MTVTSLVMQNRRGLASNKRPLRLPIIAPKEEVVGKPEKGLVAPPRIRLPPRSRTGCWTCRLNVMKDIRNAMDSLPPFALLTSDEERERKAEASSPGTYHVVVIPDSFSTLPEYADDLGEKAFVTSTEVSISATSSPISGQHSVYNPSSNPDPNVVILKTFEDSTRRSLSAGRISRISPTSEISDPFCALSLSPIFDSQASQASPLPFEDEKVSLSYLDPCLEENTQDHTLFSHFRHVVWKQLFPHNREQDDSFGYESSGMTLSVDFIEREAAHFPPLAHAIMAISALSLSHSGTGQNVDALQYYQQAFPSLQNSLRNNDDLVSDGLFLTHFLLLIYEVAAAEPHGSNLWSHHISRLLHISFLRRSHFGGEPHPFIIWWICHIDLYALLSGAGDGEFVKAMLDHQMLPGPECLLYPCVAEGFSVIYPEEHESLPVIMRLYADTFRLAAQLGFLASQLRRDKPTLPLSEFDHRSREINDLRQAFGRLWEAPDVAWWHQQQNSLPRRSEEILQQSATLFHVCHLFSYSSMWSGQRLESEFSPDGEIDHHASEILRIAEQTANTHRADRHFLVFPLFLAGATASASGLKMMAMELMTSMEDEEDGMGRNAATTRAILQTVYERQLERLMRVGHTLDVDWADLMVQEGLQMVNFGY